MHIKMMNRSGTQVFSEIPSECEHPLASISRHPGETDFVLETCCACGVIRNYAIHTGECRIVHAGFMPLRICNSPSSSILTCFFVPGFVMLYDPNGIEPKVPYDTKENVPSDTKENVPSDTKENVPSDTKENVPSDTKENVPSDTKENVPSDTKENVPSDTKENVPSDTKENVPSDTKENVPSDTKENVPSDTKENGPSDTKENVPSDTKENVPSDTKLDVFSALKFYASIFTWPIFHLFPGLHLLLPNRTQHDQSPSELLGPSHINLAKLSWEKEKQELPIDKSRYTEREVFTVCDAEVFDLCYAEVFDLIIFIFLNNEIEAMKFGNESPIWKLSGKVDGHVIKPDALASDAEGNVYISDGGNSRILKVDGLTGNVIPQSS